jgi:hypothetical protein
MGRFALPIRRISPSRPVVWSKWPWLQTMASKPVPVLAEPTSEQHQAFDLIGAPIPLILRK